LSPARLLCVVIDRGLLLTATVLMGLILVMTVFTVRWHVNVDVLIG
jgi:hypothetical protein